MIGYKEIRKNEEINALIEKGNHVLYELGYTEHSRKHAAKVAQRAGEILEKLDYDKHSVELAKIAGYMHDTGTIMPTAVRYWHFRSCGDLICPLTMCSQ